MGYRLVGVAAEAGGEAGGDAGPQRGGGARGAGAGRSRGATAEAEGTEDRREIALFAGGVDEAAGSERGGVEGAEAAK